MIPIPYQKIFRRAKEGERGPPISNKLNNLIFILSWFELPRKPDCNIKSVEVDF